MAQAGENRHGVAAHALLKIFAPLGAGFAIVIGDQTRNIDAARNTGAPRGGLHPFMQFSPNTSHGRGGDMFIRAGTEQFGRSHKGLRTGHGEENASRHYRRKLKNTQFWNVRVYPRESSKRSPQSPNHFGVMVVFFAGDGAGR